MSGNDPNRGPRTTTGTGTAGRRLRTDGGVEPVDVDDLGERTAEPPSEDAAAAPSLSREDVFELLKNERRRIVVEYLRQRDGPVEVGPLSEHVAAVENDTTRESVGHDERKRAYVSLYQGHLPKMDEYGVVTHDKDRGVVDRGPNFDGVTAMLEAVSGEDGFAEYYIAVTGVALLAIVVAQLLGPAANGVTVAVAVVTVLACFVLAVVDRTRR
jgi:hypothetical protein